MESGGDVGYWQKHNPLQKYILLELHIICICNALLFENSVTKRLRYMGQN